MSYTTRKTLLEKVKSGDEEAWYDFYNSYYHLIYSIGLKFNLDGHLCNDMVQQVMCTIFDNREKFKYQPELGKFRSYLWSVTRNVTCKIKRSIRETEIPENYVCSEMSDSEMETVFNDEWNKYLIDTLLRELHENVEELTFDSFQMYILQGMKPEKIASALGISVATVYVHKSRCMAYLKKAAAKIQQSDPGFTL